MNNLQKIIIISLLFIAGLSWTLSSIMPDMMSLMSSYNPVVISLFTISWTASMAAMMFPAIVPMVLLYDKLTTNKMTGLNTTIIPERPLIHILKIIAFVGMYLLIWTLTGLGLLLGWSIPMNTVTSTLETSHLGIIFGSILIISGVYQFSSLKNKCIGYCESPFSFFMRRWSNGTGGAAKMGVYHGIYCLGCCWPYFLIMIALGWMNLTWMALFAIIIFVEKIWSRGVLIARITGISLIILGVASSFGLVTIFDTLEDMNKKMQLNGEDGMIIPQNNTITNERTTVQLDKDNLAIDKVPMMSPGMDM